MQALQLSAGAKRDTTVGEMVNLLSVDGQKVQDGFSWIQAIIDIPVTVVRRCVMYLI